MPLLKLDPVKGPVPLNYRPPDRRPTRSPELTRAEWQRISRRILADARRNGDTCHICGGAEVRGHPRFGFSVDHLVPRSADGGDDPENLAVAHRSCNSRKGGEAARDGRTPTPRIRSIRAAAKSPNRFSGQEGIDAIEAPALVVLMGPVGSGKSTFGRRTWPGEVVSVDAHRESLSSTMTWGEATGPAFAAAYAEVRERVEGRGVVVFDSTATTKRVRASLLSIANSVLVPAHLVVLDVPLDQCHEQNNARRRVVPPDVVDRVHQAFVDQQDALDQEPWASITTLTHDNLAGARPAPSTGNRFLRTAV